MPIFYTKEPKAEQKICCAVSLKEKGSYSKVITEDYDMGISGGGAVKSQTMLSSIFSNRGRISTSGVSVKKSGNKSNEKKPKKLFYNFKQMSAVILRSKTSGGARRAVVLARSKVTQLRGKKGSDIYDSGELDSAILHAEAMVRVAKKRVKHLRQEEAAERDGVMPLEENYEDTDEAEGIITDDAKADTGMSREEIERLMREMERMMRESMQEMEEAVDMEEFSEALITDCGEMSPEELSQVKKKHRADELREITEADMKYLKSMFDRLQRAKQSAASSYSSGSGTQSSAANLAGAQGANSAGGAPDSVALELGGADMPVGTVSEAAAMTVGATVDITV